MRDEKLKEVLEFLEDLRDDNTISKNIREKIKNIINILIDNSELSLKINKAMHSLDEISEETGLPSYTRTQIWNIVSSLETIN